MCAESSPSKSSQGQEANPCMSSPSVSSICSTPNSWSLVEQRTSPEKRLKTESTGQGTLRTTNEPLTLAIRKVRAQSGKFMMHLLDTTGKAVGCGWRPATDKWESLTSDEYHNSPLDYSQRSKCFKNHTVPPPAGFTTTTGSDTSDDEYRSCGSLSDDSVDSDSDAEACKLTLKP